MKSINENNRKSGAYSDSRSSPTVFSLKEGEDLLSFPIDPDAELNFDPEIMELVEILFVILDENSDNLLEYIDYSLLSSALHRDKLDIELMNEYLACDLNCDGFIDLAEFCYITRKLMSLSTTEFLSILYDCISVIQQVRKIDPLVLQHIQQLNFARNSLISQYERRETVTRQATELEKLLTGVGLETGFELEDEGCETILEPEEDEDCLDPQFILIQAKYHKKFLRGMKLIDKELKEELKNNPPILQDDNPYYDEMYLEDETLDYEENDEDEDDLSYFDNDDDDKDPEPLVIQRKKPTSAQSSSQSGGIKPIRKKTPKSEDGTQTTPRKKTGSRPTTSDNKPPKNVIDDDDIDMSQAIPADPDDEESPLVVSLDGSAIDKTQKGILKNRIVSLNQKIQYVYIYIILIYNFQLNETKNNYHLSRLKAINEQLQIERNEQDRINKLCENKKLGNKYNKDKAFYTKGGTWFEFICPDTNDFFYQNSENGNYIIINPNVYQQVIPLSQTLIQEDLHKTKEYTDQIEGFEKERNKYETELKNINNGVLPKELERKQFI